MIYEITNGKLSLDDFEVPAQCTLRRVQHGEKRYSEDVDGMTLYYIKKKGSRQDPKCVLPASVQSVRSLLLGLGEGSVGTAGVAAAVFHLKKEDYLDQARQDPQGHPRCQVGRKPLLQQSRRESQCVVSMPVWV